MIEAVIEGVDRRFARFDRKIRLEDQNKGLPRHACTHLILYVSTVIFFTYHDTLRESRAIVSRSVRGC